MKEVRQRFVDPEGFRGFIESVTRERIFHITRRKHYLSILSDGFIKAGKNLERNWGASSFFMNSGCVSVINNKASYRIAMPEVDANLHRSKFDFSSASFVSGAYGSDPVYLILKDGAESELVSWKRCKEQNRLRETVVPYYEAGYPGDVSLEKIDCALLIDLAIPKGNGLAELLRRFRKKTE